MSVARDLYQLQEIELALEANEQAQVKVSSQIGESQEVNKARAKLAAEQKHIEELGKQQKSAEWEIEDLTAKIKAIEKKLYDGKIFNPKELGNLQAEVEDFKKKRSGFEDKVLDLMEQAEQANKSLKNITTELARLITQWQDQQKQLQSELEKLKTNHGTLDSKKQELIPQIEAGAVEIYRELRKRKGTAIARVEQESAWVAVLPCRTQTSSKPGRVEW